MKFEIGVISCTSALKSQIKIPEPLTIKQMFKDKKNLHDDLPRKIYPDWIETGFIASSQEASMDFGSMPAPIITHPAQ